MAKLQYVGFWNPKPPWHGKVGMDSRSNSSNRTAWNITCDPKICMWQIIAPNSHSDHFHDSGGSQPHIQTIDCVHNLHCICPPLWANLESRIPCSSSWVCAEKTVGWCGRAGHQHKSLKSLDSPKFWHRIAASATISQARMLFIAVFSSNSILEANH